MSERPFRVAIAAQTIPDPHCGLGYFLVRALQSLSVARPSWRFDVVASKSFAELATLGLPNVAVAFWDDSPGREAATRASRVLLRALGRSAEPRGVVQRYAERFGVEPRRLNALWTDHASADAIWVPQYNVHAGVLAPIEVGAAARTPRVLTIHDIHPAIFPDDWHAPALSRFWGPFADFARDSTRLVTHTRFQRDAIVRHLGIPAERVGVVPIPPLIDAPRLVRAEPASAATLAGLGIVGPFAFFPGSTTHSHKNHTRLILAWSVLQRRLGARCPQLVCTAKGHRWPELSALVAGLGLAGRVLFTDTVPTATLTGLLKASTLVVVPTLYEGGGSGPVADACLVGRPVVCSRIGPIVEQLEAYGGVDVEYFDPESVLDIARAVEQVLDTLPAAERRATATRDRLADRFTELWGEWADYYAGQFASAATASSLAGVA
ncbi:MAG: hypothetical protein AVDCRST_MAG11-2184 [uncultured Gemmatimonadaceae bacterium]|uniref:Uncharacterized protein n=1 Tax=uncultured Gemmatimonadaceae bacterium TaxID=246130 RepID=A0A6J4L5U1_9BACT|nr:MAG: hypothetical protein AVDCRST_MAG11-2184 [uncultured Gemmatimonadaceae bacterium]